MTNIAVLVDVATCYHPTQKEVLALMAAWVQFWVVLKSQSLGPCKLLPRPQNPAIETCANIRRAAKTCDFWTSKPFCQIHHPIIPSSFIIFLVAKVQAKNRRNVEVLYEYLMHRLYVGELGESLILRAQQH